MIYFMEKEEKKINTMKIRNDTNLKIIDNQYVITFEMNNFIDKTISFAFRPKDYFSDIFSFYYFRIIYAKNNEKTYIPLDSQLGNLCEPELDINTNKYYCYFIFSNKYNELNTNFSVSSFNLNDYFKINAISKYNNTITNNETKDIFYIYHCNNTNEIDYYIFTFEFNNNEIKSIISTFIDNIKYYYPHIYSSQMFYIISFNKTSLYNVNNKYTLIYKYIYGDIYNNGFIDVTILNYSNISLSGILEENQLP